MEGSQQGHHRGYAVLRRENGRAEVVGSILLPESVTKI